MGAASRLLLIKKGGTTLLGVSAKTITWGGEPIDITTDEDAGYRTFLNLSGVETLDISGSGVTKDEILRQLALTSGSKLLTDITIEWPTVGTQTTGDTASGDFFFSSFGETGGGSGDAISFDFSMQSSGAWVHTPGTKP